MRLGVRSLGVQEIGSSEDHEFMRWGVREFRSSGVQEFVSSGVPGLGDGGTRKNKSVNGDNLISRLPCY